MSDLVPARTASAITSDAVNPTSGFQADYPGKLRVRILPACTRLIIRGREPARAAAGHALGLALPVTPCRALGDGDRAVLWLGPDEWLLLAARSERDAGMARLRQAFEPEGKKSIAHALVDVSDRQISYEVSGPLAGDVLNVGCPLDLDSQAFGAGMCTRTLMGKAEIVLWRGSLPERGDGIEPNAFRIEVQRSYAAYVCQLLATAASALCAITA